MHASFIKNLLYQKDNISVFSVYNESRCISNIEYLLQFEILVE